MVGCGPFLVDRDHVEPVEMRGWRVPAWLHVAEPSRPDAVSLESPA